MIEFQNILTAQIRAESILADSALPEHDKSELVQSLSNILIFSLNMFKSIYNLSEDEIMSILILILLKTVEITKDDNS